MALQIFNILNNRARINLTTLMQVGGQTRFRGYTYMGLLPYAVAKNIPGNDIDAIVMGTRAYFRPASQTDARLIDYVSLQKDDNSPILLIPEPLIQAESVETVTRQTHIIRVDGDYNADQIKVILSSNGITRFTLNTEVI